MSCADDKSLMTTRLGECATEAAAAFQTLGNLQAVAIGFKSVFCEVTNRRYNPTCCALYGNMLDAVPTDLQDRWDRAYQFANDALAAIDCNSTEWEQQVSEADDRIGDCWALLGELNAAIAALQAALADAQSQGCS